MKKIILLSFLLLQVIAYAQKFTVDFDYAKFNYNDSSNYLEIYYSFYQPQLKIILVDSQKTVTGKLNIKILNKNDSNVFINKSYQFSGVIADTSSENEQKSFTGNLGFVIPAGEYICELTGTDCNDLSRLDSISFPLTISAFPSDKFFVSDLEVASNIRQSEEKKSMFYKNSYEVIPNPSGIFGKEVPVLYFYSEIYNINKEIESEYLKLDHLLINTNNKTVYKKSKLIPRNVVSAVDVDAINISRLASGTYTLVDAASDSANNVTVYSSKKIFIYNPSIVDSTPMVAEGKNVLTSEFASMSEEELDAAYNESKYLATNQEQDQWKALKSEKAKQGFLFEFWKSRDLTPETPENEFKRDYFERVKKADKLYTNIQRKGWKTDRGRVLLIYGDPTEIERYPNQVDTKPYEIWHYNDLEGGVIFVFADLTGFSDYILVHSSKRGEISDQDWQSRINAR